MNKRQDKAYSAGFVKAWNTLADSRLTCKHCKHMAEAMTGGHVCERWIEEHATTPDGFCAWGEKKTE